MSTSSAREALRKSGLKARDVIEGMKHTREMLRIVSVKTNTDLHVELEGGLCFNVDNLDQWVADLEELIRLEGAGGPSPGGRGGPSR